VSFKSSFNDILGNNVSNSGTGITICNYSNNNTLNGNVLTYNSLGIDLWGFSENNKINGNVMTNNSYGIDIIESSDNKVSNNNVTTNTYSNIYIHSSTSNTICNNIIANSQNGLMFLYSSNNNVYHNDFINNTEQVYSYDSTSVWDDGYPSGGNYWSDYTGVDLFSGPYQSISGSDGVGDTPNVIDADNQDRYPLMHPWSPLPVHNINTGLGYATIQGAIDAPETLDGHTVFVGLGTYYENVFLYKSLTLIGEDSETTIVDGSRSGHVIHVTANNVMISGFTIQNGLGGLSLYYSDGDIISGNILTSNEWTGIEHHHSNNNIIHDNKVTLNGHGGMDVWNSSNNIITYNNVSNNSGHGILPEDASNKNEVSNNVVTENSVGIRLDYSTDNLVSYNNATLNVDCGIQLVYSENSNVKKNVVTLNSMGIMLHASEHNVIEDNKVTHNGEGILLAFSNRNIVEANEAVENGGNGIRLYNSSYNEVSHNNASIDNTGIVLETSSNNNTLVGNNVASNYNGILVGYSSNNNTIYHNNFIDNVAQVYDYAWEYPISPSINVWDDGYPSGGNYWSNYVGVDVKSGPNQDLHGSDEIGDTPYVIDANNTDHYPLMNPYGAPPLPTYTLTIIATVGGTTDPAPGTYSYTANSTFQVTAIPNTGYLFDHWELDNVNVGSTNPYAIYMDKNHTLKAVFAAIPPPLSASISPTTASILVGQSVTFTSTVSGGYTPYSYQWYLNGAPVSGATSSGWVFTPSTTGIHYVYLQVTDFSNTTAQSETARIVVTSVPVGGYSVSFNKQTTVKPLTFNFALIIGLVFAFVAFKRKTRRRN
jgi:parallel beta-helix repeat protein